MGLEHGLLAWDTGALYGDPCVNRVTTEIETK